MNQSSDNGITLSIHPPPGMARYKTLYRTMGPLECPKCFLPMGYYQPQQQRPPSEPSVLPDLETEKKLLAIEKLMENQKIDFEKARKELAERDAKEAAEKAAAVAALKEAEETATWEKKLLERQEMLEKQIADEKAAWEKKVEEEKHKAKEDARAEDKAMAEAELRAKHFVLPWPSLWRGGRTQPPISSAKFPPSGDD